jgi:DNA-binding MarR family transcriptional regulator
MNTLEDTLFQHLAYACSETRQSFDQYIGMSQIRRQLLTLLSQKGEVSHAALQQQLAVDGATITRLVKQFESDGGHLDTTYFTHLGSSFGQKIGPSRA